MSERKLFQGSERLITDKWHAPTGRVVIDWARAPRGLLVFMLNNSASFTEVVNNFPVTFFSGGTSTPCQMGMTAIAPAFDPTKGTNPSAYVPVDTSFYAKSSFEIFIYYTGGSSYGWCRVSSGTPDSGTFDRDLFVDVNGFGFNIFDGAAQKVQQGSTPAANKFYHVVGVADGSLIYIYVNGVSVATPVAVANGGYAGFTTPIFSQGYGKWFGGGLATPPDLILHAALANVAWTADEVMQRYLNMYDFLVPAEQEWPSLFAVTALPDAPAQRIARVRPGLGPQSRHVALLNAALPTQVVVVTVTGGTLPFMGVG